MKIVLLGMNHRTAPVDVRERFAVDETGSVLRKLVDRPEIAEAALISTCNRVEVIVTTENADAAQHVLYDFFGRDLGEGEGPTPGVLSEMTYLREGRQAVEHVFRVASAIDSMVVGEPQILGQVKDAYRDARDAGVCGAAAGWGDAALVALVVVPDLHGIVAVLAVGGLTLDDTVVARVNHGDAHGIAGVVVDARGANFFAKQSDHFARKS